MTIEEDTLLHTALRMVEQKFPRFNWDSFDDYILVDFSGEYQYSYTSMTLASPLCHFQGNIDDLIVTINQKFEFPCVCPTVTLTSPKLGMQSIDINYICDEDDECTGNLRAFLMHVTNKTGLLWQLLVRRPTSESGNVDDCRVQEIGEPVTESRCRYELTFLGPAKGANVTKPGPTPATGSRESTSRQFRHPLVSSSFPKDCAFTSCCLHPRLAVTTGS